MQERQPRVSDTEAKGGENTDYSEARARREAAQAELAELELRRKRGEFLDRAEAEHALQEAGQIVKDRLAARNRRLGPQLAAEADGRKIARILNESDRAVLHEIADILEGK
ncbi:MAG TPA: hypothetical protein VKA19_09625 [Alphaproteobacteria bacterium]|nr:hypothetical protein [Alphaproteobacteria bacterium]